MKTLADHQIRALDMMEAMPCMALFPEAGTGKTMIALAYIHKHLIQGDIENVLVVCPKSIIASWRLAIRNMGEFGYTPLDIEIVEDSLTIISYQRLWKANGTVRGYKKYALRDNIDRHWDVCFIDESHRLGDPKSVQTKTALKLAEKCDHRYIMTGTPDSGNYVKLYGQIKFLDPLIWKNYREFDMRYVIARDFFKRPIRFDVDALESLKRAYGFVARLRDCYDMPSSTEADYPVEHASDGVYKDFISNNVSEYGLDIKVAGTGVLKALQTCSGFYLDDDGITHDVGTDKTDVLMTLLESNDDKTVVFCEYRVSIDRIDALLTKKGISHYVFDGRSTDPLWQDFQKDDTRVFVAQYQRGSEGIDLFAANRMIFYETTKSAYLLEQAKARIMRKGQVSHCTYSFIYCQDTIEERMMRSVRNNVDVSRHMLDEWALDERKRLEK